MLNQLKKILNLSAQNPLPVFVRNTKLMEEVGEFSEGLMHAEGWLPHKTMKEPLVGEVADVIICLLDTYASVNPTLTPEEILDQVTHQLDLKSQKWERIINNSKET